MEILSRSALIGALMLTVACDPAAQSANISEPQNHQTASGGPSRARSEVGDMNLAAEVPAPVNGVAELTPSECEELGGTVFYGPGCEGTLLACRGANGYSRCIDERDPQTNRID